MKQIISAYVKLAMANHMGILLNVKKVEKNMVSLYPKRRGEPDIG